MKYELSSSGQIKFTCTSIFTRAPKMLYRDAANPGFQKIQKNFLDRAKAGCKVVLYF